MALFLLYLYLATGDTRLLEMGRSTLDFELSQGVWIDGEFAGFPANVDDPGKADTPPAVLNCYWEVGPAGVGTALTRFAAVTQDSGLLTWVNRLAADASRKYTVFPQLSGGWRGSAISCWTCGAWPGTNGT